MEEVYAGCELEQLGAQMREGADAGRCVLQLPRLCLGKRNEHGCAGRDPARRCAMEERPRLARLADRPARRPGAGSGQELTGKLVETPRMENNSSAPGPDNSPAKAKVFISYSRTDEPFAIVLRQEGAFVTLRRSARA